VSGSSFSLLNLLTADVELTGGFVFAGAACKTGLSNYCILLADCRRLLGQQTVVDLSEKWLYTGNK
jgi:hypothetical protein